jgi:hypothetical protein
MPIPTKRAANELSAARPGKNLSEIKCPAPVQRTIIKNGEFVESELVPIDGILLPLPLCNSRWLGTFKEKAAELTRRLHH